jgi:hypothetical protein
MDVMGHGLKVDGGITRVVSDYLRDLPDNAVDGFIGHVLRGSATTGGEDENELTVNCSYFQTPAATFSGEQARG